MKLLMRFYLKKQIDTSLQMIAFSGVQSRTIPFACRFFVKWMQKVQLRIYD